MPLRRRYEVRTYASNFGGAGRNACEADARGVRARLFVYLEPGRASGLRVVARRPARVLGSVVWYRWCEVRGQTYYVLARARSERPGTGRWGEARVRGLDAQASGCQGL